MDQKKVFFKQFNKKEIIGSVILLTIFILPFFSYAGSKKIYVDKNNSGTQDGSSKHPYKTISEALRNASKNTTVNVEKGTYHENIEIPEDVTVAGSERDEVIIEANDNDDPAVKMEHKSHLDEVTVKKGRIGILVDDGDGASISECIIKNNDKEGIKIESAKVESKHEVRITDTIIKNNGKNGIFSEKRKLAIARNKIYDNDGDGIGIMPGSKAWISGNTIKDNDKSGMRINLDNSDIVAKGNTFRNNKREGIEIDASGSRGKIEIKRSKFYQNERYGIALIQRGYFQRSIWNGLIVNGDNTFWKNRLGNVSPIIRVN